MMKYTFLSLFLVSGLMAFSQQETFDQATYKKPAGWKRTATGKVVQFMKTDAKSGSYCLISLSAAGDGSGNSLTDFNNSWETSVKGVVNVTSGPAMQDTAMENGWTAQTGYAPFEKNGAQGVAMLITMSSPEKLVNILVLTNTQLYQQNITDFLTSVSMKKPVPSVVKKTEVIELKDAAKPAAQVNSKGFAFNQTNFDDGWVATEKPDWVEVKKGTVTILIHYPREEDKKYYSVMEEHCSVFWNLLVAPHYKSLRDYKFYYNTSYDPAYICYGFVTEPVSNKEVYVTLFKKNTLWMEIITPDKATFVQTFGIDIDKVDHFFSDWGPIQRMNGYNKFAVGPNDLNGTWTSNFSGMTQYVNANTGASAGMDTHSSSETFEFNGSTYKWDLGVASGFVGSIKFQSAKSAGKWNLQGNWQIHFSEIEKKPRLYNAYFSCIKGARMLWLQDTGYGDYKAYGRK